jgi:hypothetical protein
MEINIWNLGNICSEEINTFLFDNNCFWYALYLDKSIANGHMTWLLVNKWSDTIQKLMTNRTNLISEVCEEHLHINNNVSLIEKTCIHG